MHSIGPSYAYGIWALVLVNIALFLFFILSFLTPVKKREWRSAGVATAFIIALFTEMYGFPLTIYVLTAALGARYPALNPFAHESGHLWVTFLGGGGAMLAVIHLISDGLILAGFFIMAAGWRKVHGAKGALVTDGVYGYVRHPQYSGLFLVTVGLLIQWPTIITVLMWPVLILAYYRLAKREEKEMEKEFGAGYRKYMEEVPMFMPRMKGGAG
ncbi:MAG: isoprenylcysteine carboxylmethyltransferase family protein [Deltaproteobacteria bacterium]|nr:isoprenylcysteine carboxylmethyltransferase family protein [Deltaproteobacteria bacterium]